MKYILMLVTVLFSSCMLPAMVVDNTQEFYHLSKFSGISLYDLDIPYPDTVERACYFIWEQVEYADDTSDEWKTPLRTWNDRKGDCEDIAILLMNILYCETGLKTNLILVDSAKMRNIVDGGRINHALVEINGRPFEPMWGRYVDCPVAYRYTFDEVFGR